MSGPFSGSRLCRIDRKIRMDVVEDHMNQAGKHVNHWRRILSFNRAIIALLLLAVLVAACEGDGTAEAPIQVEGPAMIMFYTDG